MASTLNSRSIGSTLVLSLTASSPLQALDAQLCAAGVEVINAADSNPEVRCIILALEATFHVGGPRTTAETLQARMDNVEGLHHWVEALRTCSRPVIAMVEGPCHADCFALALAADFLVASQDSSFALGAVAHGLSPVGGASWVLARTLPRACAMELMMGTPSTSATRLHQLGVVNRVTPAGQALSEALALSEKLCALAPDVLSSVKELVNDAPQHTLSAHMKAEKEYFVRNLHSSGIR